MDKVIVLGNRVVLYHYYPQLDARQTLEALGDDPAEWATAFRQLTQRRGEPDLALDPEWLERWFAAAISYSARVRARNAAK